MSGIINSAGSKSGVIGTTELDYEEGTWTPSMGSFSHGLSQTHGWYTKIGNVVHASFTVTRNSGTDASTIHLDGLPFNSHDSGQHTDGGLITDSTGTSNLYRMNMEEGTNNVYGKTANGGDISYNDHGGGERMTGIIIYRSEPK